MTFTSDNYAEILRNNRIHYMPSCLIVEMMTKLYAKITRIPADEAQESNSHLVAMLRRLSENLKATAEAYDQNRISFFIGDWKDDKIRARKLFFNLMTRLGHLSEMVGSNEKKELYECSEELAGQWNELDLIMEQKCRERSTCPANGCDTCSYFRSVHPGCWQRIMANILMSLHANTVRVDPEAKLILLCYNRIREQLFRVIQEIERQGTTVHRFPLNKILVVSEEDTGISCPKCALMVDSMKKEGGGGTERRTGATTRRKIPASPNRYLMPTSLNFSQTRF